MNYKDISREKLRANDSKIPTEWRVGPDVLNIISESSQIGVIDIPQTCGILTDKEIEITEQYDATDLLQRLASRSLTSLEVVTAFCKRAAIAHQLVNCLTEIMFEDAIAQAKLCDEYIEATGKVIGPLHGLPISIKDSFNVKGHQTTMGFVSFASRPVGAR